MTLGVNPPNVLFNQPGKPAMPMPWAEFISRQGATGASQWSYGNTREVLHIDVNDSDLETAIVSLLGFPIKDGQGNKIYRELPMRHPRFPHLYCTDIPEATGVAWDEKKINPEGWGPYSGYQFHRLTVVFEVPPYAIYTDLEIVKKFGGDESQRFVYWERETSTDSISREGEEFIWAEGPSAGRPFTGHVGQVLAKTSMTAHWYQIPEDYLFNQDGIASNIESLCGTVNLGVFRGRAEGTVLFESARYEPVASPVSELVLTLPKGSAPRVWNASLFFKVFDPPAGGTTRGWNTLPHPSSNRWFEVNSLNGVNTIYQYADFKDIFKAAV